MILSLQVQAQARGRAGFTRNGAGGQGMANVVHTLRPFQGLRPLREPCHKLLHGCRTSRVREREEEAVWQAINWPERVAQAVIEKLPPACNKRGKLLVEGTSSSRGSRES